MDATSAQVFSVGYGAISFSQSSVRLGSVLLAQPFAFTYLNKADELAKSGQTHIFPASAHPDINKSLYVSTYEVKDASRCILMLKASHTYRGSGIRDGALFFRLRAGGESIIVQATLPSARESLLGKSFLVFQGRGDRLSPETLKELGYSIPRRWADTYLEEEEIDECFSVQVLAPATQQAAREIRVTNRDGEELVLPDRAVRRVRRRR